MSPESRTRPFPELCFGWPRCAPGRRSGAVRPPRGVPPMSSAEQLHSLQPPPEVLTLGEPEKVVLLTKHYGSTDSWMARLNSDANFAAGWLLTGVGAVFLALGLFVTTKKAKVEHLQL